MIIKSVFKDYYDYISKIYGGGDPKVVYIRGKIQGELNVPISDRHPYSIPKMPEWEYKWCIVCGKGYLLVSKSTYTKPKWDLWTRSHPSNKSLMGSKLKFARKLAPIYLGSYQHLLELHGKENRVLLKLSKKVKSPVFIIDKIGYGSFGVENNVPNLQKLGFDKLIRPEQMYQDISYYVGNLLKDVPDNEPPKSVNNEERIISHGFDLKTSFRKEKHDQDLD